MLQKMQSPICTFSPVTRSILFTPKAVFSGITLRRPTFAVVLVFGVHLWGVFDLGKVGTELFLII